MSELQKLLIQAERTAMRHEHWTFVEDHMLALVALWEGCVFSGDPSLVYIHRQALYTAINEAMQRIGDRFTALKVASINDVEDGDEKERFLALEIIMKTYPNGLTI